MLEQRDAIARAAADADLTPPDNLRTAFEGNDGFDDARAEIDQQLDVIDRYVDAVALRPADPDVFTGSASTRKPRRPISRRRRPHMPPATSMRPPRPPTKHG